MSKTDFPIFSANPNLVYLDSAATTQRPATVIEAVRQFSSNEYGTIHRGLYGLSVEATRHYEEVRAKAAVFLGAAPDEIVFTSGTTDGLNLVAHGIGKTIQPGDEIVVSELEHHANMLPWRQIPGAAIKYAPITESGNLDLEKLGETITARTRVIALTLCSNVLGTVFPIAKVRELLDRQGSQAILVVDAAQAVAHFPVSVRELGCDFLAFSGHKMYGPTGTGILWGKKPLLDALPPYRMGGDMVKTVTRESVEWADAPQRFESGTPNVEGIIGLGAALTYLGNAPKPDLSGYALEKLSSRATVLGEPHPRSGIIAFTVDGIHPHDLAQELGDRGICIRAGHHCAAPLHQKLGIAASNRISFGTYSDTADVDALIAALDEIKAIYHA